MTVLGFSTFNLGIKMRFKVLGCSGGIGGEFRTSAALVNDNILIDAGTGVVDLSLEELLKIDHIFLTHSHLDHIVSIAFLVDTVGHLRKKPIGIHALQATLDDLKEHIFNNHIWPDFTQIPNKDNPWMYYKPLVIDQVIQLDQGTITVLPANHVLPAVGYCLNSGLQSLVHTGDSAGCIEFWDRVNDIENLQHLIIETSFSEEDRAIAVSAKHLCASLLVEQLQQLKRTTQIYITHMKPFEVTTIMQEVADMAARWNPKILKQQWVVDF